MKTIPIAVKTIIILLLMISLHTAQAAVPDSLNYQAFLTDNAGAPIDGSVNVVFRIYNVESGGIEMWSDSRSINVQQGVFSVELGGALNPFPAHMFDTPLWIGVTLGGDAEMSPRRPVTATGFAFKAADAESLEGLGAASLDQSAHVADIITNPHQITASQVGAVSGTELSSHTLDADAHHLKTTSFSDLVDTASDAQIPDNITVTQSGNADTVDGLHAGSAPLGGQLLSLDVSGKFPNSSLHTGHGGGLDADSVDGFHAGAFSLGTHWHSSLNAFDGSPMEAVFVDSIGRVGIGTTTPAEELHLSGINPRFVIEDTGSSNPEINFWSPGTNAWSLYKQGASGDLRFYQAGDRVTIQDGTGNVGIGTTNPDHKLHVVGLAKFQVGAGDIAMSTPGGYVGMIAISNNGHRRDTVFRDEGILMSASPTVAAPDSTNGILIHENGNVGFGTLSPQYRVDVNGRTRTKTLEITGGADLSESFDITGSNDISVPVAGMVVSIDPDRTGALTVSDHAYNRRVAGIISGAGEVRTGMIMGHAGTVADGSHPVALSGRVYVLAEASAGSIEPGDLLTTSDIPGYAMKVTDYGRAQGAIIGKAMSGLREGRGQVLVLVSLL